jgi:citrate synthase
MWYPVPVPPGPERRELRRTLRLLAADRDLLARSTSVATAHATAGSMADVVAGYLAAIGAAQSGVA